MSLRPSPRAVWALTLAGIIAAGIVSRLHQTGFVLIDKYLGDALYAAMFYVLLRPFWKPSTTAICAMAAMTAIELFQLTRIPAQLLTSEHGIVRIVARLLGTQFSFFDLVAYAVGIASIYRADTARS
ncbi:DUF2809 domain-containing protein [Paludibaculum fermentans]|uniref:ribosomal maturation YjgA family protein n=1 Tax=Paludibaculum fermentans TaxID=1473598 RepID=UPI003EBF6651